LEAHHNTSNLLVKGVNGIVASNSGFSNSSGSSISVNGGGVIVFAGAQSDNVVSHEVNNGGNLMVRDVWYESTQTGVYLNLSNSGSFYLDGCRAISPTMMPASQFQINDLAGKAVFLNSYISDYIQINGNGSQAQVLGLSVLSGHDTYINNTTSPPAAIQSFNVRAMDPNSATTGSGSYTVNNIGAANQAYLQSMLSGIRSVHAPVLSALPANTTDFRLYRVWTSNGINGIEFQSSGPASSNQSPTANAGNDIVLTLPTNSTTLAGSGTDADGTIASYVWSRVSGPTTFTLVAANAATTSLSNLVQGTYTFRLTVTDNNGATGTDDVMVTVNPAANQPPTANAGNNITITLPTNSTTLTGSGSDPDGTIASYVWSRVSGPTTFTLGSANAATTTLTNLVQGTYTFRLTVTDNNGATATDDVTVTVNPAANQPPTANAGNNITITLPTNSTTLTGSGIDADGTIASYVWSRVSGPTTFTLGAANAATTSLSNLVQGTYTFRLTVTDNNGATGTDDVIVTVNPAANQPPTANAGNNITITLPTNSTTLTGSGSDPDGTIASYAWSRVSGPTTFTISAANSATTTLTNLVQGVYTFRLTVTDNNGATGTDDVIVTVNPAANQPPTANAGNNITITLPTNSTTLTGSGTDVDGTIASYSWSRVSGPTTFTFGTANAATTSLSNLMQGTYTFRLTVTDNNGATGTDDVTVTVTVNAINQPPIARTNSDSTLVLPDNSMTLRGNTSTDPDGIIVSYEWTQVSGPSIATINSWQAVTSKVTGLTLGIYTFQLKVTDDDSASAITTVKVFVKNSTAKAIFFNVYPNPTTANLTIQYDDTCTGKLRILICDVNKRLVKNMIVNKDQAILTKTINTNNLVAGAYFIQVICAGNQKQVRKFIKM
jgi:hypothetical protein